MGKNHKKDKKGMEEKRARRVMQILFISIIVLGLLMAIVFSLVNY